MAHQIDMIMDWQYGSTGKGLIAGYLAKRGNYDTVVCSFAPNAGHTYIDASQHMHVMTQQLPTAAIVSKTVKNILIGPGALIDPIVFWREISMYGQHLHQKNILIHPHAAIVLPYHCDQEIESGMTKIGSTAKGVGAAMIERIRRIPGGNVAMNFREEFNGMVATESDYREALQASESLLIEGAQGFSLSIYHGQYPYVTSRDVTPWQIAADCGLPYRAASYIKIIGTARTFPIRVNNRDGSSGPCYEDQRELQWSDIPKATVELTTVTKLPRRIFTFSEKQIEEAAFHCGGYWDSKVFLNFANYCQDEHDLEAVIAMIERPKPLAMNPPSVAWIGWGADDADVKPRIACGTLLNSGATK